MDSSRIRQCFFYGLLERQEERDEIVNRRAEAMDRQEGRLRYWIEGPEDAPVVVMVHGATLDHHMFDPQVTALVGLYRVIRVDLPGHGASRPAPATFSVASLAQDLLAVLQAEGITRVALVGQSMGGDLCQEFLLQFPEMVDRMALIGCVPVTRSAGSVGGLFARWAVMKLRLVPLARFRQQVVDCSAVKPQSREYARECIGRMTRAELVATWRAIASTPHEQADYRLPCPTLMIVGEQDAVGGGWVRETALRWAEQEPRARLATIPAAGHIANLDAPHAVNDALQEFLGEA